MASCKDCLHYGLCERLDAIFNYYNVPSPIHLPTTCSDFFKNTADVVEVKHGRWIILEAEIGLYSCSVCEHKIIRAECNYCPNCGAKMDGKDGAE